MNIRPASSAALRALMLSASLLVACQPLPKFDSPTSLQISKDYPRIRPLDEVLAVGADAQITETDTAALQARAAALQGRAAGMAGEAPDPETRARLDAAIAASGG